MVVEKSLQNSKPVFLLQGIDFLEPFIPIEVPKYSDAEVMKVMDYYEDRKWIQYPEGIYFERELFA